MGGYTGQNKLPKRRRRPNRTGEYVYDRTHPMTLTPEQRKRQVYPQADNIIDKFGGAPELCRMVNLILPEGMPKWVPSTVYRWTYPVESQGQGGEIPTRKIKMVLKAARYAGIVITIEDLYPKLFD